MTTSNETANLSKALRDTASLVQITISSWQPWKQSRELGDDLARANNADARAFRPTKNIFHGAGQPIKRIKSIQDEFRNYHYSVTLPFGPSTSSRDTGPRLLPNVMYFDYMGRLADSLKQMNAAVDDFVSAYDRCIEQARPLLGDAFDPDDYPPKHVVADKFSIVPDIMPVPDGAQFAGLDDSTLERLAVFTERSLQNKLDNAMGGLIDNVGTFLERATRTLSNLDSTVDDPDARTTSLHKSLFSDAERLAKQVKGFSFAGDNEKLQAAVSVLEQIADTSPDELKKDAEHRRDVIGEAEDAFSCFNV